MERGGGDPSPYINPINKTDTKSIIFYVHILPLINKKTLHEVLGGSQILRNILNNFFQLGYVWLKIQIIFVLGVQKSALGGVKTDFFVKSQGYP